MPLNARNTLIFHRTLYAGMLKTVTILKRGDDQQEGTVTAYTMYQCRRSRVNRTGEPIQHSMTSQVRAVWHMPHIEMKRLGINFFSAVDRIVETHDESNNPLPPEVWNYWQPESTTYILEKLFLNVHNLECLRVDPPRN